ncbi:nuclear body protein SP140-like protein isoform X2 [Tachysurus fulvidraco]|uniref:nuclear body protein SP140-like protein isoform X2 n=1 Tax=Tachysurus fulvidraco TaxID=1234273 RepID=UPI001FF02AB9|nr:nuclear body protein SP140-like protein isoform X2 [Tachysurus fulvidraco]
MDIRILLDLLPQEKLIKFLRCKKTEICSYVKEPQTFLQILRDHELIPDDHYQKVIKRKGKQRMQENLYEILDWLVNERGEMIKQFWSCVFQEHILQKNPLLRQLQTSLLNGPQSSAETDESSEEVLIPLQQLITFFRRKKTEISSLMDDPQLFFDHLEDHGLISDDLYQKVIKMKSMDRRQNAVYMVLKSLEKEPNKIKEFWSCVFKEHIMRKYPFLRSLQSSLNRSVFLNQNVSWPEKPRGNEVKQVEQKKCGTKRKKSVDETEEEVAGPSSVSSSSCGIQILDDFSEDSDDDFSEDTYDLSGTEDMSKFEATELPVSCGSVTGVLHKRRFRVIVFAAGPHSKSIRTEEQWFSPEEFVKQGPQSPFEYRDWMENILCHGKALCSLKFLEFHPLECHCQVCCPKNPDKDDLCFICNDGEKLVFCTKCPRAFHHLCHLPTVQDKTLGKCTFCVLKAKKEQWAHMSKEQALASLFTSKLLRCAYLLMVLYKTEFHHNLSVTEESVSSVSSKPSWLNKVKSKMEKNKYTTVREFVKDINLIFENYEAFYEDNADSIGAKMKKIFEEEFDAIFKIQ